MNDTPHNTKHPDIPGWGVDMDRRNDPTYPIRKRDAAAEQRGYNWVRPAQQPVEMEVLHSIERPNVSAVFGTSVAPSGLSGRLRRRAFAYGEGKYRHWLPLMLADRINVIEGLLDDLRRLRIPNICAEKGYKAQWKYDRQAVVSKAVAGAVAGVVLMSILRGRQRKS